MSEADLVRGKKVKKPGRQLRTRLRQMQGVTLPRTTGLVKVPHSISLNEAAVRCARSLEFQMGTAL